MASNTTKSKAHKNDFLTENIKPLIISRFKKELKGSKKHLFDIFEGKNKTKTFLLKPKQKYYKSIYIIRILRRRTLGTNTKANPLQSRFEPSGKIRRFIRNTTQHETNRSFKAKHRRSHRIR